MLTKISGVRDPENLDRIIGLNPAYITFDFCTDSEKYVGQVDNAIYSRIPKKIRRVGVFRNNDPIQMIAIAGQFTLNALQLDGQESVSDCEMVGAEGMELIKLIENNWQFEKYEGVCNKFLVRNLQLIEGYSGKTPIIIDSDIFYNQDIYCVDIKEEDIDRFIGLF